MRVLSIGEFCKTGSGGTPSRSKRREYYDGGTIPWIKSGELAQSVVTASEEYITEKGLSESSAKFLEPGAILIAMYGATVGQVSRLAIPAATNQAVCHVYPDRERCVPDYLYRVLKGAKDRLLAKRVGGGQPNISQKIIRDFKIPLPPLPEQKRIAAILDAADALRAKRRESIKALDDLVQSTFLEMFGDPVTNPKGWEVVRFETLGKSRLGKMLDKGKEAGDCQYPYLANFNVQWGRFELGELREMDFDQDDQKEFELRNGDLLICEGGEVGRSAIWRCALENVYFQKALHRVRLNPAKALPEFGQHFMWFMAKNGGFRDFTNSATIAHLTGAKLKGLPVPLPPLDLQQHFATIVETIEQQKARCRAQLDELDTLFASLQSRAFNGEL